MAQPIDPQLLVPIAIKYGIDPDAFIQAARLESSLGATPDTPGSQYRGLFQIGYDEQKRWGNLDVNNPLQNAEMAARGWSQEIAPQLTQSLGREPTWAEVYLAHQQGVAGATHLLQNPNAPAASGPIPAQNIAGNIPGPLRSQYNASTMTAGEFANIWLQRFGDAPTVGSTKTTGPALDPGLASALGYSTPPAMESPGLSALGGGPSNWAGLGYQMPSTMAPEDLFRVPQTDQSGMFALGGGRPSQDQTTIAANMPGMGMPPVAASSLGALAPQEQVGALAPGPGISPTQSPAEIGANPYSTPVVGPPDWAFTHTAPNPADYTTLTAKPAGGVGGVFGGGTRALDEYGFEIDPYRSEGGFRAPDGVDPSMPWDQQDTYNYRPPTLNSPGYLDPQDVKGLVQAGQAAIGPAPVTATSPQQKQQQQEAVSAAGTDYLKSLGVQEQQVQTIVDNLKKAGYDPEGVLGQSYNMDWLKPYWNADNKETRAAIAGISQVPVLPELTPPIPEPNPIRQAQLPLEAQSPATLYADGGPSKAGMYDVPPYSAPPGLLTPEWGFGGGVSTTTDQSKVPNLFSPSATRTKETPLSDLPPWEPGKTGAVPSVITMGGITPPNVGVFGALGGAAGISGLPGTYDPSVWPTHLGGGVGQSRSSGGGQSEPSFSASPSPYQPASAQTSRAGNPAAGTIHHYGEPTYLPTAKGFVATPGWLSAGDYRYGGQSYAFGDPDRGQTDPYGAPVGGRTMAGYNGASDPGSWVDATGHYAVPSTGGAYGLHPSANEMYGPSGNLMQWDPGMNYWWDPVAQQSSPPNPQEAPPGSYVSLPVPGDETGTKAAAICTHFMKAGRIQRKVWAADTEYSRRFPYYVKAGYRIWALPVVRLMRRHKAWEAVFWPFAKHWSKEMAYRAGVGDKGSLAGKVIHLIGAAICWLVGWLAEPNVLPGRKEA